MRIPHRSLALPLTAALFACSWTHDVIRDETPSAEQDDASPLGNIVSEIDPRIWCIHQSRHGDHWFGSNGNGVYRYDGQVMRHYTKADGLSGDQVRSFQEDGKGNVFISTTGGVSKFDGKSFVTLEIAEALPTEDQWVLNPEDVWIVYNPGENGPFRYDGEKLHRLVPSKSPAEDDYTAELPDFDFSPTDVYSVYKDRRGHIWFGTAGVGLCRFDGENLSWMYEKPLTTTPRGGEFGIRSIYEDRAGDFWICNTRQRFKVSSEIKQSGEHSLVQYEMREGLPNAQSDTDENFTYFPSITEDDAGVLWMACGSDGVLNYDGESVTRYPLVEGVYALAVFCDQKGKLWVGTLNSGVFTFEGEGFEAFELRRSGK